MTGWDPSGRMTLTEAVGSVTQVAVNSSKSTSNALRLRFVFQKVGCYVFEEAVESIVIEAGVYILFPDLGQSTDPYVGSTSGQPGKGKPSIQHRLNQHVNKKIKSLGRVAAVIGVPDDFTPGQIRMLEQHILTEANSQFGKTSNKTPAAGKRTIKKLNIAGKMFKIC